MIASEAPWDCAYNTRTGTTMPMPIYAAQTPSKTASNVRLRAIVIPLLWSIGLSRFYHAVRDMPSVKRTGKERVGQGRTGVSSGWALDEEVSPVSLLSQGAPIFATKEAQ